MIHCSCLKPNESLNEISNVSTVGLADRIYTDKNNSCFSISGNLEGHPLKLQGAICTNKIQGLRVGDVIALNNNNNNNNSVNSQLSTGK